MHHKTKIISIWFGYPGIKTGQGFVHLAKRSGLPSMG